MADARNLDDIPITIIGHPWAPIGMGEQLRSHIQACTAVLLHHRVFDIFRYAQRTDATHARIIGTLERDDVPPGIRIFHINGDEVERVIAAFEARGNSFADGYNIIVPAWELPAYPKEWAPQLQKFDEVWALSRFIGDSLTTSGLRSHLIGQAVEMEPGPCLPRRHFGIRESAFVLLNFFDLSSYATRKNPEAVRALLERIRAESPFRDVQMVLKVKNGERGAEEWAAELKTDPQIKVISTPLDTFAVKSLINACDCFVSLHRAEGFGRGLGEAMALGKLVLGTGWSGNVDFMTAENSLLVRHDMVRLKRDDYPHWKGQSWANPDVDHAFALLRPVLDDPARGGCIARRGQADVLRTHGNRAVGLRVLARLGEIAAESPKFAPTVSAGKPTRRKVASRSGVAA
ncbi:glycosyltransferase [Limobrevibacterium gyesilva]|uniref:Glycosyltransferase n=1 Tax=Limobrevibacterium gyesilva TaxID=2991712 RepID=A0AA41YJ64_9PROT|nr:glycosyltransferase [Limobrevibacterium gyesilva]MCW3473520.1 glycosyltransferase [Limobrevibacterium gyesilva]